MTPTKPRGGVWTLPFGPVSPAGPAWLGGPGSPWDPVKPSSILLLKHAYWIFPGFNLRLTLPTYNSKTWWSSLSPGAHRSLPTPLAWWSLRSSFTCSERRKEWACVLWYFSCCFFTEQWAPSKHYLQFPLDLVVRPVLGDPAGLVDLHIVSCD